MKPLCALLPPGIANPADAAALLVVFLNGSQAPFMDQKLGWNVDGTEMKIRLDFKAQGFDPKGILNPGKMFDVFHVWKHTRVDVKFPWDHK